MAYVLCYRPLRLISKSGHATILNASLEPQVIADALLTEALSAGCVRSNERGQVFINDTAVDIVGSIAPQGADAPDPAAELPVRDRLVVQAVKTIVEAPDPTHITGTGVPRVFAVSERCGFKVSQSEVLQALKTLGY